ncbi:hypothetical protein Tco_0132357 [Tanacetum coccineum]
MDTKLLSAPESNNTLAKCWFRRNVPVASSGWPFVSAVPGLMTHLVASLTLDSARSCVIQGAFLTQGKASSILTVFSWDDSISLEGFLPSILLLVVIIVAVVVVVVLVVVVVGGSSIIKLSFAVLQKFRGFEAVTFPSILLGWANKFHQDKAYSVRGPVANFTLQSSVQLLWENTDSVRSNQRMRPTAPSVPLKLKDASYENSLQSQILEVGQRNSAQGLRKQRAKGRVGTKFTWCGGQVRWSRDQGVAMVTKESYEGSMVRIKVLVKGAAYQGGDKV